MFLRYSAKGQLALDCNDPRSRAYIRRLACRALSVPQPRRIGTSRSYPETEVFCFLAKSEYGCQLAQRRLPPIDTVDIELDVCARLPDEDAFQATARCVPSAYEFPHIGHRVMLRASFAFTSSVLSPSGIASPLQDHFGGPAKARALGALVIGTDPRPAIRRARQPQFGN